MVGFIDTSSVLTLVIGALILSVIAVVIDRLNFPQRRFRAKQIKLADQGARRDRTGAHIIDTVVDEPNHD
jgi:hypothetical protein